MNKQAIWNKLHQYKELQEQFVGLGKSLIQELPPGNEYGIETTDGDVISIDILILGHPCKAVFGIQFTDESAVGGITFQRLFSQDRTVSFLTVYFDNLGNAREELTGDYWTYSIKGTYIKEWLAFRVLEGFFKSFAVQPEG